jgi:hypothetical protein
MNIMNQTAILTLLAPAVIAASADGAAVDCGALRGRARVTLSTGVFVGSHDDETLDVKVQASADGSTGWADVVTFTQLTTAAAAAVQSAGLNMDATARYLRVVLTAAGTAEAYPCCVTITGALEVPVAGS